MSSKELVYVNGKLGAIQYREVVETLKKKLPHEMDLLHMTLGIAGEAGEIVDAIKKHVIYGKELDRVNILEELGDIKFYIEGLQQILGMTDTAVLQHNAEKLWNKRYPNGYSDEAAIARADKIPVNPPPGIVE